MIIITTMPYCVHRRNGEKEKKLNISDFRRRRRRRRLYSFRVCTFSYYPSISPEKCPKYLSFLRFSFFAFIIISARNSALFFPLALSFFFSNYKFYNFEYRVFVSPEKRTRKICVCFASCAKRMHFSNVRNQGLI